MRPRPLPGSRRGTSCTPVDRQRQRAWLSSLAFEVDTISALIERLKHGDPSLPALACIRGELRAVAGEPTLGWQEIDHVLRRLTTPTPSTARLVLFAGEPHGRLGRGRPSVGTLSGG